MLVLARRKGQAIRIGDAIEVRVLRIRHGRSGNVALGITAPRQVPVFRTELLDENSEEQIAKCKNEEVIHF